MASWIEDKRNIGLVVLSLTCLLLLGLLLNRPGMPPPREDDHQHDASSAEATIWTCSMHPNIRQPEPGLCPICGMDLIPVSEGSDSDGPWSLTLSEHARSLAQVQTAPVERRHIAHEIRMVGKVAFDEKRVGDITAWVAGRIDRLFVDFTGIEVREGDHMVELYSPSLVTAQQELRQAVRSVKSGPSSMRKASESRLRAARKKLGLLGLSSRQIEMIERSDQPTDHLTIESPMEGVVIEKHLNEGAYVNTGSPIYTVADLSRVWIILDAYESDLAWLRYGQEIEFEVEAYPGESFSGRIVFIDPVLNPRTRTVKVRIDVPNPNRKLKPDMFVRAVAHAMISGGGKVMDPGLAGKWICPMHQEIVKEGPDACDVCGMDLVQAEDLGFVAESTTEPPLVVPASAVLVTGERGVVYVEAGEAPGTYEGREIRLGPETGDFYVVTSGLEEGDRVVVNGAFKIDSELQIRAKYSMMYHPSAPEDAPNLVVLETHAPFRLSLDAVYGAYFQIQDRLSRDDLASAHKAGQDLAGALKKAAVIHLDAKGKIHWDRIDENLAENLDTFAKAPEIEAGRAAFEAVSEDIYRMAMQFGSSDAVRVLRFHCPMAFDNKGAHWLQNHESTANPYFGASMFACGSQVEDLAETRKAASDAPPPKAGGHDH
ncbi:Efflux RND transporter periplasmic adaptor subunit [Sulfidibacter corallicola]|uniref:Efflux RND transporter periplasmic adaptor subunit n=1 Tax=Sulfidibacter corallicola TaxID=2818388 RepID=A0A8A4TJ28_SULCO|nr:efflux RND transporter periplasmic adaptor subunit [Sulfidibacter corallicola]QTD49603.1 efflux RND transporter periplasmic adaptor subunit [Sulfidibacter corallicola]